MNLKSRRVRTSRNAGPRQAYSIELSPLDSQPLLLALPLFPPFLFPPAVC